MSPSNSSPGSMKADAGRLAEPGMQVGGVLPATRSALDSRLAELVAMAARESTFYRDKWSVHDVGRVTDAQSFVETVPLLRKPEIVEAQQAAPPFGGMLCVPEPEVRQVNITGGTSGLGTETYGLTAVDARNLGEAYARGLVGAGVPVGARVAMTFPMSLSAAPQWIYQGLVDAGYCVLPLGSYDTEQKIRLLRAFAADVLIGTPSYADYLAQQLRDRGFDPREDLSISKIFVATEQFSVQRAQRIEAAYGARLFEWYGCTQRGIAFTCSLGAVHDDVRGVLHFDHRNLFAEVVDPDSGASLIDVTRQDLPEGVDEVEGELVLTFLAATATPLIRFATRDRVRAVSSRRCTCGRPGFGLISGAVSRYDAMIKIRGVTIDPAAVDAVVLGLTTVKDYRVRVFHDESGRERLCATVVPMWSTTPAQADEVRQEVATTLRNETGLTVDVTVAATALETFDDTRHKARRWSDERDR